MQLLKLRGSLCQNQEEAWWIACYRDLVEAFILHNSGECITGGGLTSLELSVHMVGHITFLRIPYFKCVYNIYF